MKKEYRLEIGFPFTESWIADTDTLEKAVKATGMKLSGSGAGMGQRDIDFYCFDTKQLEKAEKVVLAFFKTKKWTKKQVYIETRIV